MYYDVHQPIQTFAGHPSEDVKVRRINIIENHEQIRSRGSFFLKL